MANTKTLKDIIRKGDAWGGCTITATKTGFDFTGTTIKMEWRTKPGGTVYLTQNPSVATPSIGTMTFPISLTGAQSNGFPVGIILTDIQFSRISPLWGPYTPIEIQLQIVADITQ